jgi:hypothetical protein
MKKKDIQKHMVRKGLLGIFEEVERTKERKGKERLGKEASN